MDYKKLNLEMYEKYARKFATKVSNYLTEHLINEAKFFINNLPGKHILDLGSGPGIHAQFFKERGLNPLCFDISPEMVKICKEKGLDAEVGDLEDMRFEDNSFDGVWSCASILHVPKAKIPDVFIEIKRILKPGGLFFIGVKEGEGEKLFVSESYPESKRLFSYFREDEMRQLLLDADFEILKESKANPSFGIFLNFIVRKK